MSKETIAAQDDPTPHTGQNDPGALVVHWIGNGSCQMFYKPTDYPDARAKALEAAHGSTWSTVMITNKAGQVFELWTRQGREWLHLTGAMRPDTPTRDSAATIVANLRALSSKLYDRVCPSEGSGAASLDSAADWIEHNARAEAPQ